MTERMTAAEYRELTKGKSKYGNRRTQYKGVTYDSQAEANRAAELDMLVRAGEVAAVMRQVPFTLAGGIVYRADFVVLLQDGTYRIEDVKGVRTQTYKLKKRLMAEKGLEIVEV